MTTSRLVLALLLMTFAFTVTALGQRPPDPETLLKPQREAMAPLSIMDGVWRGQAWIISPTGEKHELTQTERVGSFLGGSVKVVEGKGYEADGRVAFNAFATIFFDPAKKTYTMHSYAQGNVGDFAFTPKPDGFVWEIPAGPMTLRYTAVIKDGSWHEVGDRIATGKEPVRFFEMKLKRIGNTDWPNGGAVNPK
ncbi:MAG TPA: hypothetical protein VJT71_20645 [Pyrinomonadaceae bacterium]|nr:hypothetical protein [Pyrinomonadaceae bacterium]